MKKLILIGMVAVAVAGLSCTEERTVIRSTETETVHMRGVLYGWRCGVGDLVNNPRTETLRRFGVYTGEPAKITLVRDNGFTSWFRTDDSSRFDRYLSAGTYMAIIETGYTWPADTISNLHLVPGDTVLDMDIVYHVLDPERINFCFSYGSSADTTHLREEFQTLFELNNAAKVLGIPGPLNLPRTMPESQFRSYRYLYSFDSASLYVFYDIPIIRVYGGYFECWNVLQACDALRAQIEADTTGAYAILSANPTGSYACLWGK